jgi:transcriptional regulator with AAA-type ATPase domain
MPEGQAMHYTDEFLHQLTNDRQHERQASAAAHRLVGASPASRRLAHSLRAAADLLDRPVIVGNALPGRGSPAPGA